MKQDNMRSAKKKAIARNKRPHLRESNMDYVGIAEQTKKMEEQK